MKRLCTIFYFKILHFKSKFSNLLSKSSKIVLDGVKNFVVKQHKFPITRIADNLIELKSSPDTDDYRYFDPKLLKPDP